MKLIGKQIVVELPDNYDTWFPGNGNPNDRKWLKEGFNRALSEVAKMNPAWEVDEKNLLKWFGDFNFEYFKTHRDSPPADVLIRALATNPSAWLKRKASDEAKEKV